MNDFNVVIPLQKSGDLQLEGIASALSVDKDEEKMSEQALKMMVDDIKRNGVNLFENHEHGWENTLGRIYDADLVGQEVKVKINLDDPTTNPKIPMLLNKMKRDIKLGLSVGGNVTSFKWEFDKTLNKKIKVLDKVKIYEVSVVGIPSNSDSFLSLPHEIAKSMNENLSEKLKKQGYSKADVEKALCEWPSCPVCFSELTEKKCSECLWEE